ncbi:MAG: prepilin-type cleavage/methylation protein [Proteobacteria bacterium]|nr:prepilin-type cleavage/methylation protein [Pseudomonadota bacterium]
MSTRRPVCRTKGFTLVELTIVLVIVALLIGGILVPLSAQRDLQNTSETQRQFSEIKDALLGFAVANGRLPRPATSLADGAENPALCADDAACTGYLPWTTLGLKKTDAWNKMIRYSATPAYANSAFALTTVGSKKVQTRDSAGAISYLIGAATCSLESPCAPAVIYSAGKNNWGVTEDGNVIADESSSNADEDANASAVAVFFARAPSTVASGGEFDDIVAWLSPNILFNRMICAGKLP